MRDFHKRILLVLALLFAGRYVHAQNQQQVISAGGAQSAAVGGYTIDFGIGEAVIATAGQGPVLTQGFLQPPLSGDFPAAQLLLQGAARNTFVQLNWTTTCETANALFYIERSGDGINFITIDSIPSKAFNGTSTTPLDYQHPDLAPLEGNNYYRIRQVDQQKNIRYSGTIRIMFRPDKWSIQVYPNPVHDILRIKFYTSLGTSCTFRLFNVLGQECLIRRYVSFERGYSDYSLYMGSLPAGMYFLLVTAHSHGSHQTVKLLKD